MWKREFSKVYEDVNPKKIWSLWEDVDNWPKWHRDLEYCKLDGKFSIGSYFILKPKNMGAVKIKITALKEGEYFTDCTEFFGAKMYDTHRITKTKEGLKISNSLWVTGPLSWIWIKLVAQYVASTIEEKISALVELSKKSDL